MQHLPAINPLVRANAAERDQQRVEKRSKPGCLCSGGLRTLGLLWLVCLGLTLVGCVGRETVGGLERSDPTIRLALAAGLEVDRFVLANFDLLTVAKPGLTPGQTPGQTEKGDAGLHVYLAGDGSPWRNSRVQANPSPRRPVAMQLMLKDPAPSLFVGRPCYHLAPVPGSECTPTLWTFERYGEKVLAALAAALQAALEKHRSQGGNASLTLIGYSGGGVLATLLGQRVPGVTRVITLGAPLDVTQWIKHHGYTPLIGSLDPTLAPRVSDQVRELHLQGELDTTVPPAVTDNYFTRFASLPWVQRLVLQGVSHDCCWEQHWPIAWPSLSPPDLALTQPSES